MTSFLRASARRTAACCAAIFTRAFRAFASCALPIAITS
jgi:hypothetical protein